VANISVEHSNRIVALAVTRGRRTRGSMAAQVFPLVVVFELEHARDGGVVLDDQHSLRGSGHGTTIAAALHPLRILTEAASRAYPGPVCDSCSPPTVIPPCRPWDQPTAGTLPHAAVTAMSAIACERSRASSGVCTRTEWGVSPIGETTSP
jgi:hypothetical protein